MVISMNHAVHDCLKLSPGKCFLRLNLEATMRKKKNFNTIKIN